MAAAAAAAAATALRGAAWSLGISVLYVASLYLWPGCAGLPRDNHAVIRRRCASAVAACAIAAAATWHATGGACLAAGISMTPATQVKAALRAVALTAVLFAGPIATWLCSPHERRSSKGRLGWRVPDALRGLKDLRFWRNYVVAPLSEEFVFRGCTCALLIHAKWWRSAITFLSPLFFGVAHAHHALELVRLQQQPISRALLTSGVQLSYTTVFGWYATYLLLRTGQLMAPIGAHVFCNYMGFPDIQALHKHPLRRLLLLVYAAGIVGFGALLQPMTEMKHNTLSSGTNMWQQLPG
eukprot:jgi/Chlat1/922/Chrsp108S01426